MLPLMSRPNSRFIDFGASRFVVSMECGLNIDGKRLERGEEVPAGVLSAEALRQVYEPPLRRIELFEYAVRIPDLAAVCAAHGLNLEEATPEKPLLETPKPASIVIQSADFDTMSKAELVVWCDERDIPTHGTIDKIRKRIAHYLSA